MLQVSEDTYANGDGTSDAKGDAKFTVSVDGKQIGGAFIATASHAAGQEQTVTLNGNFGAGNHTVSVDFLNDAYAGTPSTDRNLYVNSITADGVNANQSAALLSSGTRNFTVTVPASNSSNSAMSAASASSPAATIPASQSQVTEQINNTTIQATSGDHSLSLQGNHDTVSLLGGPRR